MEKVEQGVRGWRVKGPVGTGKQRAITQTGGFSSHHPVPFTQVTSEEELRSRCCEPVAGLTRPRSVSS